ncbi:MAG: hypothetical protein SFY56_09095 [Bacteroidota bacterium]|nr:hypothetical protein [Bacteroidota bacterium]
MKILPFLLALPFFAFSCNTKISEEDNIPTSKTELLTSLSEIEDTIKQETEVKTEIVSSEISLATKPLLIARGSEPGWYAEFFKDRLRLLLDYGKDSVFVEANFSDVVKAKSFKSSYTKATAGKGKTKVIALAIVIDIKSCTEEASGDKRERTITLKYNGKTYRGCATAK